MKRFVPMPRFLRSVVGAATCAALVVVASAGQPARAESRGGAAVACDAPDTTVTAPFSSPIVFLVRRGNPKNLRTWNDLLRPEVRVVAADPKRSRTGRFAYLAAWAHALGDGTPYGLAPGEFVREIYRHVPELAPNARGAVLDFAVDRVGDVLLTFESEVGLIRREFGPFRFEAIHPQTTILADVPLACLEPVVVDGISHEDARFAVAALAAPAAQERGARRGLRPHSEEVAARHRDRFPAIDAWTQARLAAHLREASDPPRPIESLFERDYAAR